jgi:hypothetical protein
MKIIKDDWDSTLEEIMERYSQIASRTRGAKIACDDSLKEGGADSTYNFRDGLGNLFDSYDES